MTSPSRNNGVRQANRNRAHRAAERIAEARTAAAGPGAAPGAAHHGAAVDRLRRETRWVARRALDGGHRAVLLPAGRHGDLFEPPLAARRRHLSVGQDRALAVRRVPIGVELILSL